MSPRSFPEQGRTEIAQEIELRSSVNNKGLKTLWIDLLPNHWRILSETILISS